MYIHSDLCMQISLPVHTHHEYINPFSDDTIATEGANVTAPARCILNSEAFLCRMLNGADITF